MVSLCGMAYPKNDQTHKAIYKNLKMFNQVEVDSADQLFWRNERVDLHNRIHSFCKSNQITFTSNMSNNLIQNCRTEKIVFMWLFDLIPDLNYWQDINQTCKQSNKVLLIVTDNIIKFNDLEFVKFFSYPELLGIASSYNDSVDPKIPPTKLYNCFMQRIDSVRQSWFYFLNYHDLMDKGYVSFLLKQLTSYSGSLAGKDLFDYIHKKYALFELPHFEQAYHTWKDKVPFRNFNENFDLTVFVRDSKYSLILETYAVDDDREQWCFTEKLLRGLQFPNYLLPFCQKDGINILKSLGFQFTLDMDFLDHLDWQQRQQELLKFLINDPVDFDSDFLYHVSSHNRNLLASWKMQYQKADFFDNFYERALQI